MPPKKRLKENRGLPARWTRKHGAIYYLVPPDKKDLWEGKKWFRLGKSLAEAHRTFSERIHQHGDAKVVTMQNLLDRFEFEHLPTLAPATRKYYIYALPMVRKVFTTNRIAVAQVEPHHAYKMTKYLKRTESTKKAKQAAECLSSALSFAVREGVIKANPLIGQFEKPSTKGRDREVSDKELLNFAATLPRKWQLYIMLKLFTKGRRKGELFRIRRSHLIDEGIRFVNNKRPEDSFIVGWTPELRDIVKEILDIQKPRVGDAPLFYTREFEPYIKEDGQTSGFDSIWQRYMRKAVAKGLCAKFTEHDLRAKAVENETLEAAQRLLRHTNIEVTKKHYRRKPEQI